MIDYRLCNVLVTDGTRSEEYPDLYYRQSSRPFRRKDGSTSLGDTSYTTYDFATYFNLFSNIKWKRYTVIDNVNLRIVARGKFVVRLTAFEDTGAQAKRMVLLEESFAFDDEYGTADLAFPESDAPLLSFELLTETSTTIREAFYFTRIDEEKLRDVELSVAMTTIGKEEYVYANAELFKEQILGCDEPIAKRFTLHIVDNGRTLDAERLEQDRVTVHPNPNVGGSGGFTRGMIESLEQDPKPTHVLLMDDDVQISPESLKRTYNLLTLVKDKYVDALVSGAMLSLERQDEFYEDMGYVTRDGIYRPAKEPRSDDNRYKVSNLDDVMHLETVESHNAHSYAAWWYCCIPTHVIEKNHLPLPVFIRGDDVEYGNRIGVKIMTMSGICVWHMKFALKYRAALERYQTVRNCLIAQATTGVYPEVDFMVNHHIYLFLDFKTFNYDGVELSLMAIEDFLKGPEYLKHVNGEDLFKLVMSKNEKLVPLEEIDDPRVAELDFNPALLYTPQEERSILKRAYDLFTFNGQRGPARIARGGIATIPYDGWYYPPNDIRGKDAILAVTRDGKEGVLRKKDRARFKELHQRYKTVMKEFDERRDEVAAEWAAARDELTSVEFWKWYLEDQKK